MIEASTGLVHSFKGKESEFMVCVKGLPEPWSVSKFTYLTLKEARELKEQLEKALTSGSPFDIFG